MIMQARAVKPLGHKAYGSIPHLPGSRMDRTDKGVNAGQTRILTERARDVYDRIIVQEKLDGSCVSVARINGVVVPLIRAGYPAQESKFRFHHEFANWVSCNQDMMLDFLNDGERAIFELLTLAHGTRYDLPHIPLVCFDIMRNGHERATVEEVELRTAHYDLPVPSRIWHGRPISVERVKQLIDLGGSGHGALDPVEGAVWRCERKGKVEFLAKWVRPDKEDGCYLPEKTGDEPIWNRWKGLWTRHG